MEPIKFLCESPVSCVIKSYYCALVLKQSALEMHLSLIILWSIWFSLLSLIKDGSINCNYEFMISESLDYLQLCFKWIRDGIMLLELISKLFWKYEILKGWFSNTGWLWLYCLTHWGQVTHICIGKLTIIGSDNGLSPGGRQAIIWTNAGILLIGPLGTNFNEISIGIQIFSFKKMHLKMSSAKWRPFCLGLNVLNDLINSRQTRSNFNISVS